MTFDDTADIKVSTDNRKMREKMMTRLIQNNILERFRPKQKSYQTVIIWDWDDTLMASTFLSPYQSKILEPSVRKRLPKPAQQQLDQLQELVIKLLKKSVSLGPTYIITNAGQGWVELSSGRFLPLLHKQLIMNSRQNGINVISARALFEKQMPNGFKEWKHRTFLQLGQ